jgi:hypothetical protein
VARRRIMVIATKRFETLLKLNILYTLQETTLLD